jgi:hypothetical protein
VITHRRLDAALYEPTPPRTPRRIGRPRLKGKRLPTLVALAVDPATLWTRRVWVRIIAGCVPRRPWLGFALWLMYPGGVRPSTLRKFVVVVLVEIGNRIAHERARGLVGRAQRRSARPKPYV